MSALDEKITDVRALAVDSATRQFGEELKAFVEKTIEDNQKVPCTADTVKAASFLLYAKSMFFADAPGAENVCSSTSIWVNYSREKPEFSSGW